MSLKIKPFNKTHDPKQLRIGLRNDAGDLVVLRCRSRKFAKWLIPDLEAALDHFEIIWKGGE